MTNTLNRIKSNSFFIIPVVFLFFFGGFYKQSSNSPVAEARWTGTLRLIEKYEGQMGTSERVVTVYFTSALPTLHRNDPTTYLYFSDDKGTGTSTYHAEGFIGQKKISTTDCSGNGASELHEVVVNKEDNFYTIHAIGPACSGTTVNLIDGKTEPYGPEYTDITVSDQPLGSNLNLLSGSQSTTQDIAGMGTVTTTISWNLTKSAGDAELIVTPQNYDNWLPEPGRDELTQGSVMIITLKLQGRNGRPLTIKVKEFRLQLLQTSREKGIALNSPKIPMPDQLPDLRFLLQPGASIEDEFQVITIPGNNGTTGQVKLASYDGGGWATLNAYALLDDDTQIKGTLLVSSGTTEIEIPKRNPGSVIAKVWADANGNPADMEDKEEKDPHASEGDGLTAYEEYRGFFSEGRYKRLDPAKKELAVRVKIAELGLFSEGLNWFEQGSKLKVVRFYIHEVANDRRINFNSGHAHGYDQYALKLDNGNLPSDKAGKAFTTSSLPDIPKNTTQVVIAVRNISVNYQNWLNYARGSNQRLPWTEREYIAQTVAHEIGHGVKVWHHGEDSGTPQAETAVQGSPPVFHIFNRSAIEITTRPFTIPDRVCSQGTQASGDLSCVMAYIDVCDWVRIPYADGSVGYFESPLLSIGRGFCKKKDGTDENAGFHSVSGVSYANLFGKAGKGECLGQITLR